MDPVAIVAVVGVLAAVGLIAAAVHPIPVGSDAVVTRSGTPLRSKGGGLIVAVPVVERVHMVTTGPRRIDPLAVSATTRDGVEIQLVLSVLFRVTNPAHAVLSRSDVRTTTTDAVERTLHHLVGEATLVDLLQDREATLTQLDTRVPTLLEPSGVELIDIDLLGSEVRVGAQLLHLLTE